ncbi:FRG domain-containing protein [Vibrio cholerae]|uniref:FRG domain-containing protein n=1 Tax=Vibrio paracholerae TaxID=650003 RepID=A0AAX1QLV6_9VIBR|nr:MULTISPECIES: FRG domain-containing protein [Vibrio]EKO3781922.1 FRG domain-containing protein [Vibrio metschnikovii]EKO3888817.1 FRG domain-containing protein [Vibrio metschnikovii]EKO3937401.1 FRG domain-containing protein [Vibrio metschnikovii]KAA0998759.1 FRG domain-containing protein [Vibrio cholerae]KAA1004963.1 FRG domain-containing protein [Vibrio cholerae]
MKEIELRSWSQFSEIIEKMPHRQWLFRGQSDYRWKLVSSLERAFNEAESFRELSNTGLNKYDFENILLDNFKTHAHLYLEHLPQVSDDFSWLSLMQHHGAPTRLLDFTFSPFVALYFALESGNQDAAIFCLNHHAVRGDRSHDLGSDRLEVFSDFLSQQSELTAKSVISFAPVFSNTRLLHQQGVFVTTNTLDSSIEDVVSSAGIDPVDYIKIKVPTKLRFEGLKLLNKMNVTSSLIYPGLDGFCKSMKSNIILGSVGQKRVG